MKNIYVIGRPLDLYRTQTFVKAVMDANDKWNLSISYFSFTRLQGRNIFARFARLFVRGLEFLHALLEILRADFVYMPAMITLAGGGV